MMDIYDISRFLKAGLGRVEGRILINSFEGNVALRVIVHYNESLAAHAHQDQEDLRLLPRDPHALHDTFLSRLSSVSHPLSSPVQQQ